MFLPLGTGAVGFATGGETFDVGGAQEIMRDDELAQQCGLALTQGQGRGVAELVYLSQQLGEEHKTVVAGKKKENGIQLCAKANLLKPLKPGCLARRRLKILRNC